MNTLTLTFDTESALKSIDTTLANRIRTFLSNANNANASNFEAVVAEYRLLAEDAAVDMRTAQNVLGIIKPAYLAMKERIQVEA